MSVRFSDGQAATIVWFLSGKLDMMSVDHGDGL